MYVLVFYVPKSHLEAVKEALFAAGAGALSGYERCAWQVEGEGQFAPGPGSNPYIGQTGKVSRVGEYRVEILCPRDIAREAVDALLRNHPYEVPAYHLMPVLTAGELGELGELP